MACAVFRLQCREDKLPTLAGGADKAAARRAAGSKVEDLQLLLVPLQGALLEGGYDLPGCKKSEELIEAQEAHNRQLRYQSSTRKMRETMGSVRKTANRVRRRSLQYQDLVEEVSVAQARVERRIHALQLATRATEMMRSMAHHRKNKAAAHRDFKGRIQRRASFGGLTELERRALRVQPDVWVTQAPSKRNSRWRRLSNHGRGVGHKAMMLADVKKTEAFLAMKQQEEEQEPRASRGRARRASLVGEDEKKAVLAMASEEEVQRQQRLAQTKRLAREVEEKRMAATARVERLAARVAHEDDEAEDATVTEYLEFEFECQGSPRTKIECKCKPVE
eukprot:g2545.t1